MIKSGSFQMSMIMFSSISFCLMSLTTCSRYSSQYAQLPLSPGYGVELF
jgi:hypothetical protein